MPDVSFAVGDTLYTLNAADFGYGPADEGFTLGGIQSRGDQDFDIFGDVFLKSVYAVCECPIRVYALDVAEYPPCAVNQGEQTVGLAQRDD